MSTTLRELTRYCAELLDLASIRDYCPNGLQVEGREKVSRIVAGVTACQALIDAAIEQNADLILVHHGYFWKGEAAEITGLKRKRLKSLLGHDLSLLAYHLPLDAHPELGNNAQLAGVLDFDIEGPLDPKARPVVGNIGHLKKPMQAKELQNKISKVLGRDCQHVGDPDQMISSIGWCTGAAQGMIEQAVAQGVDAYLSGEISEPTFHTARETGVHYFSAGHHATERYGVQALAQHLSERFDLDWQFIDIDNPV